MAELEAGLEIVEAELVGNELEVMDWEFWGDDIIKLQDDSDVVNILVYGKSGAGKTVLGGSDDKVLFIAPEDKGTLSAKRQGSTAVKWTVKSWDDIERAYNRLCEWEETRGRIPFNWIVLDSATFMQQMLRRGILDDAVEENKERDPDTFQIQEWGVWMEKFKRFVIGFNNLDVNVLYTALVTQDEDEDGNTVLKPDIQGTKKVDMSQVICSYMTSYGYLKVGKRKVKVGEKEVVQEYRRIIWKDTGTIQGKDRTDALAPFTDDMTLKDIRLRIEASGDKKKPSTGRSTKKESANA